MPSRVEEERVQVPTDNHRVHTKLSSPKKGRGGQKQGRGGDRPLQTSVCKGVQCIDNGEKSPEIVREKGQKAILREPDLVHSSRKREALWDCTRRDKGKGGELWIKCKAVVKGTQKNDREGGNGRNSAGGLSHHTQKRIKTPH